MKKLFRALAFVILIGLLVAVRFLETELFYDPFMRFFAPVPGNSEISQIRLFLNVALRFWINSCISLGILYVVFGSKTILKFSGILFLLVFVILFPAFIVLMQEVEMDNYLAVFYVRRFLVHPILILILLPAFYYQRLKIRRSRK